MTRWSGLSKQFWTDFRTGQAQARVSWLDYLYSFSPLFSFIFALNVSKHPANKWDHDYAIHAIVDVIVASVFFLALLTLKFRRGEVNRVSALPPIIIVCGSAAFVLALCLYHM